MASIYYKIHTEKLFVISLNNWNFIFIDKYRFILLNLGYFLGCLNWNNNFSMDPNRRLKKWNRIKSFTKSCLKEGVTYLFNLMIEKSWLPQRPSGYWYIKKIMCHVVKRDLQVAPYLLHQKECICGEERFSVSVIRKGIICSLEMW